MKRLAIIAVSFLLLAGTTEYHPHSGSSTGGLALGLDAIHKFGANYDVDTTTDPADTWDCHQLGAAGLKPYASDSTIYVSSDDENDAGLDVTVQGLDENGLEASQTMTLGAALASGTTTVEVTGTWDRVFRAFNDDATAFAGNVWIHLDNDAQADGVPDAPLTDTLACVRKEAQQTLMAHYTVPANKVGWLVKHCSGVNPTGTAAERARVALRTRKTGKSWRAQDDIRLVSNGNGIFCHEYPFPRRLDPLTDIRVEVFSVATNDTGLFATFDIFLQPN